MRIAIFILFTILNIKAESLIYPNGKVELFKPKVEKSRSIKNKIYYKNGIQSRKTQYQDTRKIYVSFGKEVDIDNFAKKYHLKILHITNKIFYTVLFEVLDDKDIIVLCSEINLNEDVRYAKPNWKAPKYLK